MEKRHFCEQSIVHFSTRLQTKAPLIKYQRKWCSDRDL